MTIRRRAQRGVSLLEALIAVALLAALSAMLAPAIHHTLRLTGFVVQRTAEQENHRIASEAMSQILSNAVMLDASERLRGSETELRVVSLAGGSVARQFSLTIRNGRLTGDVAPLLQDKVQGAPTLLLEAGALGFSYYGRISDDAPMGWVRRWESGAPPLIVRLETASGETGGPSVIDVPVAARGVLFCEFDPVSRRCRD